jgi:uncharacterized membrane protein
MIVAANILIAIVAALHLYFLVLEMFLWTKPIGLKTFKQSQQKADDSAVLAANQGLYNGFLAAGLIWGLAHPVAGTAFSDQGVLLVVRHRRRALWRLLGERENYSDPGSTGAGGAHTSVDGIGA